MTVPRGLLVPHATLVDGDGLRVSVELDVRAHRFLRDHLVDSRPLLSTVMGIETIASAVGIACPGRAIAVITDVVVGPPYLLPEAGRGRVAVTITGTSLLHCVLASDAGTAHFTADVALGDAARAPARRDLPIRRPDDPYVAAAGIYALFFHGPSFRVLRSAHFTSGVMIGHLAEELPPIVDEERSSAVAPLLIELCLQTAGLWELGALGRMMIPDGIDRVTRYPQTDVRAGNRLAAMVVPHRGQAGRYVFDAQVVDAEGRVRVDVQGYRTIEFGAPFDLGAAAHIREQLSGISRP